MMKFNVNYRSNSSELIRNDDVMRNILKCMIFVILCSRPINGKFSNDTTTNDFVERCRRDCVIKRDVVVCGKYRMVRWLNEVVREKEFSYGPFKIIKIPSMTRSSVLPELPKPRDFKFGVADTLKFMRDVGEDLVTQRAIVYTFEPPPIGSRTFSNGPIIVDEDEMLNLQREHHTDNWRLFKKKKSIILPVLILLNLVKLKLMLIPILFGVHLIKKLIVIGGLFVPGILSRLKICKVPPYPSHHPWMSPSEISPDYSTGYGHDEPGWLHRNDVASSYGYHGYSPYPGYYRQR